MAHKVILPNLLSLTNKALSAAEALCAIAKEKLRIKVSDQGKVSNYLIAESYMDLDDKKAARSAYQNVYNLGQNQELAEESLFNFAKLSYELAYDPYNQAIDAF